MKFGVYHLLCVQYGEHRNYLLDLIDVVDTIMEARKIKKSYHDEDRYIVLPIILGSSTFKLTWKGDINDV